MSMKPWIMETSTRQNEAILIFEDLIEILHCIACSQPIGKSVCIG